MMIVTVARKPLGDNTVARNALTHGTGSLNIDGCRLPIDGEVIAVPQSSPASRRGVVGRDLGITGVEESRFQRMQRESIARTMEKGRWPANLLISGDSKADLDDQMGWAGNRTARVALFDNQQEATSYNIAPEGHHAYDYGDRGPVSRYFKVVNP